MPTKGSKKSGKFFQHFYIFLCKIISEKSQSAEKLQRLPRAYKTPHAEDWGASVKKIKKQQSHSAKKSPDLLNNCEVRRIFWHYANVIS